MRGAYYNEIDPYAARWLRALIAKGLIADGDVDERSIVDVRADDLRGYAQVHLFAGIGGWSYAARLAGWPDERPLWTGSCPCQPFSPAGKQQGTADPRHLWPYMGRLVAECRPAVVVGEQVASRLGREWLAGVFADLESVGYACAGADLCAAGVGAPHIRQRLYWMADAECDAGESGRVTIKPREGVAAPSAGPRGEPGRRGGIGGLVNGILPRLEGHAGDGDDGDEPGRYGAHTAGSVAASGGAGAWSDYILVPCLDGKTRRLEPGLEPLVDGLPFRLVDGRTSEAASRKEILKGLGNAIVPTLAAQFLRVIA